MSEGIALIGVDWGTSNLRVLRIGANGRLLGVRADPRGAGGLGPDDFPHVLAEAAGDWITEHTPVLVCGMPGARDRWIEVPYRPCPAGLDDLAGGLVSPDGAGSVQIVPGVGMTDALGLQDVIRGEETQIMGLDAAQDGVVVLPGTHSKWADVEGGRIVRFRTFMTGELFAAMRKATVLGAGMGDPGADDDAFNKGVARGLADPAITAALFSVRIEMLAGRLGRESTADYLSGLLIGAEIAAQDRAQDRAQNRPMGPIRLVGSEALTARYVTALAVAGITEVTAVGGADITARGLWRIWEASRR